VSGKVQPSFGELRASPSLPQDDRVESWLAALAGQPLRLRSGQAGGGCPHVGGFPHMGLGWFHWSRKACGAVADGTGGKVITWLGLGERRGWR